MNPLTQTPSVDIVSAGKPFDEGLKANQARPDLNKPKSTHKASLFARGSASQTRKLSLDIEKEPENPVNDRLLKELSMKNQEIQRLAAELAKKDELLQVLQRSNTLLQARNEEYLSRIQQLERELRNCVTPIADPLQALLNKAPVEENSVANPFQCETSDSKGSCSMTEISPDITTKIHQIMAQESFDFHECAIMTEAVHDKKKVLTNSREKVEEPHSKFPNGISGEISQVENVRISDDGENLSKN